MQLFSGANIVQCRDASANDRMKGWPMAVMRAMRLAASRSGVVAGVWLVFSCALAAWFAFVW
jgi:hypothetical protein